MMMVYFRFLSSCFIDVVLIQVIAGLLLLCYANDVKLQVITPYYGLHSLLPFCPFLSL